MRVIVLCALVVSGLCGSVFPMSDLSKWSDDEIGERWVGRIKETLKDSFMTLLATSEFATKRELRRRVESAIDALKNFKNLVEEEMVSKEKAAVSPTPAQELGAMQAPAPAPEKTAEQKAVPAQTTASEVSLPASSSGLDMALPPAPMPEPAKAPVVVAQNTDPDDDLFSTSMTDKFDSLAVTDLHQSVQELMALSNNELDPIENRHASLIMAEADEPDQDLIPEIIQSPDDQETEDIQAQQNDDSEVEKKSCDISSHCDLQKECEV